MERSESVSRIGANQTGKSSPRRIGAFGFKVEGFEDRALQQAQDDWPTMRISQKIEAAPSTDVVFDDERASFMLGAAAMRLDRRTSEVLLDVAELLDHSVIVHPVLAAAAATFGYWMGRQTFHAGSFAIDGGAWGVFGRSRYGKTTLLGELASKGVEVLSDDTLAIDNGKVLVGPRVLDLRARAAEQLGVIDQTALVRGDRRRLFLPPARPETPIRGWIFLDWADEIELVKMKTSELLVRLPTRRSFRAAPTRAEPLLDLAELPAFELRRPQAWDRLEEVADRLLDAIS